MTTLQESKQTTGNETIAVIIVNYRTADLVTTGLSALRDERSSVKNLFVVVVDNNSGDDSVSKLTGFVENQGYDSWVKIIAAPKNGGFAYGNNLGFKAARDWLDRIDFFWVLNPDAKALPGSTQALIDCLQRQPKSIAGSKLLDEAGAKQISAFNFPSVISEACSGFSLGIIDRLFSAQLVPRPIAPSEEVVPWLSGASLMLPTEVQQHLGDMDQKYFLYFEEVDYLLKARKMGIECRYAPQSEVVHQEGASTGISDTQKPKPQYWFESRRRYFMKNHGRLYLLLADCLWLIGYSTWLVRKFISNRQEVKQQPPRLWRDFLRNSQLNPANWRLKID